jgi:ribosomal protein S18 acetylase RimI-like enzyme
VTRELRVVPGDRARLEDVVSILGWNDGHGCLCQYWRLSSGDYSRTDGEARRELLRGQLADDPPAGMVAYLGDEPVGWLGFGVRQQLERLVRSRTIPAVDDRPVWSVVCMTVRVGYRRRGIGRALLDGLIAHARRRGAAILEAYPVDTRGVRIHGSAAYVGVASTFEAAGFRRVVVTDARSDHLPRVLMRLEL